MSSCERCWSMAYDPYGNQLERYQENIRAHNCTPEQQAGPDAGWCPDCGLVSLHQYTKQCMNLECDTRRVHPVTCPYDGGAHWACTCFALQNEVSK